MTVFSDAEVAYLKSQRLARLATIGTDGQPHVVPTAYRLSDDEERIEIGGWGFGASRKYRDMRGDARVAVVVDDFSNDEPSGPRGIEIRGRAEIHETGGEHLGSGRDPQWVSIRPQRVSTWGIVKSAFESGGQTARSVRARD